MIDYKDYTGVIEFDPSIDAFHGSVIGLQDVVTFEGRSLDELRREMAQSVEDYLDFCAQLGKVPERPYRGEFLVRTTADLHRAAAVRADASGLSLNAWVEATLAAAVKHAPSQAHRVPIGVAGKAVRRGVEKKKGRTRSPKKVRAAKK